MTAYGRLNLLALLGTPAIATLAAAITPALDSPDGASYVTIFLINLLVMLVAALLASLLLRRARRSGDAHSMMALLPSSVPAVVGSGWYLYRSVVPDTVAPGREFLAVPVYLLVASVVLWIVAWLGGRMRPAGGTRR